MRVALSAGVGGVHPPMAHGRDRDFTDAAAVLMPGWWGLCGWMLDDGVRGGRIVWELADALTFSDCDFTRAKLYMLTMTVTLQRRHSSTGWGPSPLPPEWNQNEGRGASARGSGERVGHRGRKGKRQVPSAPLATQAVG